jgi:tripartite-type tricarboxylate transporter receptor subunit TctC
MGNPFRSHPSRHLTISRDRGRPAARVRAALAAMAVWPFVASPAAADAVADFYRGKTVAFVIGVGPGGGYDLSSRLVAQHFGRFIPGNPTVVPRNMPGASGIVSALNVFNVAPRDGTVVGMLQPTFVVEKVNDRSLKFESDQFTWIGRVDASVLVGIVWHSSPVQSVADAKQRSAAMAAIGAAGTAATVPWALNALIGSKFKVVLGYDSSPAMGLAMERGEVDGNGSTSWDYLETKADWRSTKSITFLYTIALSRHGAAADVPTILELAGSAHDRDVLKLIASGSTIGRSVVGPPDIPADRVAALRQAFDAMVKDPEFLADARNRHLGVEPLGGAELQRIVADVARAPDDVVETMKAVTRQPK